MNQPTHPPSSRSIPPSHSSGEITSMLHAPTHPNSQLNAPIHHTKGTHQSQSQTNLTQSSQATNLFTPLVIKSQVSPTTSPQLYPAPNQAPPPPNYPSSSSQNWGHNIQRTPQLPPSGPTPAPATTAPSHNITGIIHVLCNIVSDR